MKRQHSSPILALLFIVAIIPAAFAQSLPASMAYSSSIIVRHAQAESTQILMIAGNSLTQDYRSGFDLSDIPAAPDSVVRDSKGSSSIMTAGGNTNLAKGETNVSTSKLYRSAMLLGVLAIAYLATQKRTNSRMKADISEMRNFPKKRLAHREAHA
jgi:hypothetical protein